MKGIKFRLLVHTVIQRQEPPKQKQTKTRFLLFEKYCIFIYLFILKYYNFYPTVRTMYRQF